MQWVTNGACTPYAVIDDYLPSTQAHEIAAAFPRERTAFRRMASFRERKWTSNAFDRLPDVLHHAALGIQSRAAIDLAQEVSGISGLLADPSCYAGGVSIMERGDFLNPHIDNSHDASRTVYRRLNLLYYCNPDWRPGDGGELELWDRGVRNQVAIEPRFNRLVLMLTDRTSWHSVAPIRRGERRCVSSYFFTEASPDGTAYSHVTSFTGRPEQRLRRAWSPLDNLARQVASDIGMRRRGLHIATGQSDRARGPEPAARLAA